jgi:long-subunit fatty acid transport protein
MKQLLTILKNPTGRLAALALVLVSAAAPVAQAQDDLLGQLEQDTKKNNTTELVEATFKSTRLINGHTVQTPGEGTLVFLFSHNFGTLNSGAYEFFGLDNAQVRLALEYAVTDRLEVGLGRSSLGKTIDGFLKYKAIQQSAGAHAMPVSVTLLTSAAVTTYRYLDNYDRNLSLRTAYTYQALVARKFSSNLSLQLMPTLIHRNLVMSEGEKNDVYALGGGGRYKLTKRFSVDAEYYYLLSKYAADNYRNSIGLGVDIETGGHIFQLHISNAQGMIEKQFIAETPYNFFKGDIFFGFNVSRNFTVKQRNR